MASVKIPQYNQQTNTPTALMQIASNPVANPVAVSDAEGRGMLALSKGLGDVADAFTAKDNADGVIRAGETASKAHVQWAEYFKKKSETATDGAPGFTGDMVKEFDAFKKETIANEPNIKGRMLLESRLNSLGESIAGQSINFEARAGIANRDKQLEATYQNYAALVSRGEMTFTEARKAMGEVIANAGYDPILRNERFTKYNEKLAENKLTGDIERNPSGTKTALEGVYRTANLSAENASLIQQSADRLGISATDLQAIISYETGGKFDPSIRGGKNNKHIGLIQFGEEEQKRYGASQGQSFADQMKAVERYLIDRGVQKGDNVETLYRIVNGGNRNAPLSASDGNGTIAQHVEKIKTQHMRSAVDNADPDTKAAIRSMDINRVPTFLNHATSEDNRQRAVYRSQVEATLADQTTMYMNGDRVDKPLTQGQFQSAYGIAEGNARYEQYTQIAQLGQDIQSLKTMPVAQQESLLAQRKPDPNMPGYALATKRYDALVEAVNKTNEARLKDPMAFAENAKIGNIKPINWNEFGQAGSELKNRVGVAQTMTTQYGAPMAILTQREAQSLTAGFAVMTSQQKLAYINQIRTVVTDPAAYRSIMQQVAPDSPVTAMAGIIMQKQDNLVVNPFFGSKQVFDRSVVAQTLLEGEALINPTKTAKGENGVGKTFPMPKDEDLRTAFNNTVGNAFAGDPAGAAFAFQGVKAFYAGKAAREGDVSGVINSSRASDAVTAVLGNVVDPTGNGQRVIAPWGMPEDTFKDKAKAAFTKEAKANGLTGALAEFGNYGLQNFADSKYLVRSGTGFLQGKNGPIVVDLTTPASKVSMIPTDSVPEPQPGAVVPQKPEKQQTPITTQPKTK